MGKEQGYAYNDKIKTSEIRTSGARRCADAGRKLRAKVQVGKPPCPAGPPFEGRKPTLTGLVAVTTVRTIIYGPCRSRLRLAHFSRQSSKTRYYSRRGTPSPITKVRLTHWPSNNGRKDSRC